MKIVLDTNVVVSAFLSPAGKPSIILQLVLRREHDICINAAVLAEYEQVLCRSKFAGKIFAPLAERFFEILRDIGISVISLPSIIDFSDESDRKFYDIAKTANAILITGNKRHFPDEHFIMDPAEFLLHQKI